MRFSYSIRLTYRNINEKLTQKLQFLTGMNEIQWIYRILHKIIQEDQKVTYNFDKWPLFIYSNANRPLCENIFNSKMAVTRFIQPLSVLVILFRQFGLQLFANWKLSKSAARWFPYREFRHWILRSKGLSFYGNFFENSTRMLILSKLYLKTIYFS